MFIFIVGGKVIPFVSVWFHFTIIPFTQILNNVGRILIIECPNTCGKYDVCFYVRVTVHRNKFLYNKSN
jgi:hypothetical protein